MADAKVSYTLLGNRKSWGCVVCLLTTLLDTYLLSSSCRCAFRDSRVAFFYTLCVRGWCAVARGRSVSGQDINGGLLSRRFF